MARAKTETTATQDTIIRARLTGTRPLLMHSARLMDDTDDEVAAYRRLTKKTNKDQAEIGRLEFALGMWINDEGRPVIPGDAIERMFEQAGPMVAPKKLGKKKMQAVVTAQTVDGFPLEYDGPKTADGLWKQKDKYSLRKRVVVSKMGVFRVRPRFPQWSVVVEIALRAGRGVSEQDVIEMLTVGGSDVGLGDWRPKYGTFDVEILK